MSAWLPRLGRYFFILLVSFLIADLMQLYVRKYFFPPIVKREVKPRDFGPRKRVDLQVLVSKNLFSDNPQIPESLKDAQNKGKNQMGPTPPESEVPIPSTLPIQLIGTIVHSQPEKSIANVDLKGKNLSLAVRVGLTIDNLARLEKVERGKIIIRNLSSNRLEFVELKDVGKLKFSSAQNQAFDRPADIKQVAPNKMEVSRSVINRYTQDLSTVLQQASMLPVRSEDGQIMGFRFVNIQPDSVYSQLGFQIGDVIKSVNGEFVDSPARALELYNALKGSDQIKITIERGGVEQDLEFSIK